MKFIRGGLVIGALLGGVFVVSSASALTYTRDVDVRFTFNSAISVVLDSADIEILNLVPGTSDDSNIVNISVSTNSIAGYTISATTGNSTYNNTNMNHTNGTNVFSSIAENASEAALTTDNTWGYSVSGDSGSSWTNFSGLPIYTTDTPKQLAKTDGPSEDITQFKINARAATSQPAGDYKNVINFIVVANTPPRSFADVIDSDPTIPKDTETGLPTIQAINEDICDSVELMDDQFQVTDSRDHKTYWIAKLKDGHCWMTQNLDLDIPSTALTSETTDLTYFGNNGYDAEHGYNKNTTTNVISWTPTRATIPTSSISTSSSISGWTDDYNTPYSVDAGDWYWTDTWYASGDNNYLAGDVGNPAKFATIPYLGNGTHGHVGNYYNWPAAVASNDASSYTVSTNNDTTNSPQNSICPAGWRLPTIYDSALDAKNEYRYLLDQYDAYVTSGSERDKALTASPFYFVRGGFVSGALYYSGSSGSYWSSTVNGSNYAFKLYFVSDRISPADDGQRHLGYSLRCLNRTASKFVVTFNANDGSSTTKTQEIKRGTSTKLATNSFTRSGYIFNGWNTKADGLGEGYGDKASYSVPKTDTSAGITLYAQWLKDDGTDGGVPDGSGSQEAGIAIGCIAR